MKRKEDTRSVYQILWDEMPQWRRDALGMSERPTDPLFTRPPAQEQPGWKLDKPARVGGATFGKGVPWGTVIRAAQREYDRKPLTPDQTEKLREMFPPTPPKEN
jgi:hypothetical protein